MLGSMTGKRGSALQLRWSVAAFVAIMIFMYSSMSSVDYGSTNQNRFAGQAPANVCISRDGGITNEGVGSFMQRVKSSIILSQILGADLFVDHLRTSAHGYGLDNFFRREPCPPAEPGTCQIDHERLLQLLPSICSGIIGPQAVMSHLGIQGCTTVYQRVPDREVTQNFNDCVSPFYRKTLGPYIDRMGSKVSNKGCAKVAVHIRWGDLNTTTGESKINRNTDFNQRSMSIDDINNAWDNLEFVNCKCTEVNVYIKDGPGFEPGTFSFKDFNVIDTGEDLLDLAHYTYNDIYLQGGSSYPVLGSFSTQGKIIVTDQPKHEKYEQRYTVLHTLFEPGNKVVYECPSSS